MAYGIQVKTGAGNTIIQLDSNTKMRDFTCVNSGSAASVPNYSSQDLVFVNRSVSPGSYVTVYANALDGTLYFSGQTNPIAPIGNAGMAAVSANFVHLKPISSLSEPTGDYGLKIYNTLNQVAYDSRYYLTPTNATITSYFAPYTRSGNPQADDPLTTDISKYGVISDWLSDVSTPPVGPSTNPTYKGGYFFSNNHPTYGTGLYWISASQAFLTGGAVYQYNYNGNILGELVS